jgi:hypothetical protein
VSAVTSRFDEVSGQIVGAVRAGVTLDAACRQAGVSTHTAQNWAKRGRKEPDGRYGGFARDLGAARVPAPPAQEDMSWAEFEACLAKAIRAGSVQAMRVYASIHRPGEGSEQPAKPDAFAEADQLAQRRANRAK